ncbi:MAG: RagB/SusD family nutrient uptake outer membrane protein [Dysgonamonadaceae bacterium]|nr:RagB/SusD family nutrient uptake outer membrane protein [Dysgonamonadaceae bacterium]
MKRTMITNKIKTASAILLIFAFGSTGCNDYLNVIPDNIANLDHVFETRETAENYLATLYTHMPNTNMGNIWSAGDIKGNILWLGADDAWTFYDNNYAENYSWKIARGEQNSNSPLINAWDGWNGMNSMFKGIRDCNIFIEEMQKPDRVPEVGQIDRARWIGEANFLKAMYHFFLFRMYGPIPITDVNIPVSSTPEEIRVKRNTVDEVVDYLANLCDKAAADLPLVLPNKLIEEGRAIRGAALTLKAKILVTAASDLFNGNDDYKNYVDLDGVHLFPTNQWGDDIWKQKWQRAADACAEAIESLPEKELYYTKNLFEISNNLRYQINLREAFTERYNEEIIWTRLTNPWPDAYNNFQIRMLPPRLDGVPETTGGYVSSFISVTLGMAERFYSKNGVPIEEDRFYDYEHRYETEVAGEEQNINIVKGTATAKLNMNRENRFYASLLFDGARVYWNKYGNEADYLNNTNSEIHARFAQRNGLIGGTTHISETGYYILKLTSMYFTSQNSDPWATVGGKWYNWPEFRLADLYLLYAEALNEVGQRDLAIEYIDRVRARSGLEGVKTSWSQYSREPNKPNTQDGLRKIIHQEREIELAFEGQRIWDIRRWKEAADFQNKNMTGWNTSGRGVNEYYQPLTIFNQQFVTPRDYLWPISIYSLQRNPNLVQNPGW